MLGREGIPAMLDLLMTFDPQTAQRQPTPVRNLPVRGVASGSYVYQAQPGRVLILAAGAP